MKKSAPAASPDAYVAALNGWRRACVEELRATARAAARLEEVIKWRNLVYFSDGPVLAIRAEADRVLVSYWRGQRLRTLAPQLRAGGKYEMATLELRGSTRRSVTRPRSPGDPSRALVDPSRQ